MAIQLYKSGNSHTIRGIKCDVENFSITSYQSMLDQGWYATPEEIGNDAQDNEKEDEENAEEKAEDATQEKINPIRLQAKDAGIDGWDIKRIKTLEALLDEQKD